MCSRDEAGRGRTRARTASPTSSAASGRDGGTPYGIDPPEALRLPPEPAKRQVTLHDVMWTSNASSVGAATSSDLPPKRRPRRRFRSATKPTLSAPGSGSMFPNPALLDSVDTDRNGPSGGGSSSVDHQTLSTAAAVPTAPESGSRASVGAPAAGATPLSAHAAFQRIHNNEAAEWETASMSTDAAAAATASRVPSIPEDAAAEGVTAVPSVHAAARVAVVPADGKPTLEPAPFAVRALPGGTFSCPSPC